MSNGETALQIVIGLEQLRMQTGIGGGVRRTPEDLIEDARKYQAYLDEGGPGERTVFVVMDQDARFVGVYGTWEEAEQVRLDSCPTGEIGEWQL